MKKIISFILGLYCIISFPLNAFAASSDSYEDDFLADVAEIMSSYQSKPDEAKQRLAKIDAFLVGDPVITEFSDSKDTRGLLPSQYTLSLYCMQRGTTGTTYYLMWELNTNKKENYPGPLDYISIEWDTEYASYYSANADGVVTTKKGISTGIVLFNIEDSHFDDVDYAYGSVRVTREKTGKMRFGSKFVHTYTSFSVSGSASFSFSPSINVSNSGMGSLGLSYTNGFVVNVGTNTSQWEKWEDSLVTF